MCSTGFHYDYCVENWFHRKVSGRVVVLSVNQNVVTAVTVVFLVLEEIAVCKEIDR